MRLAPHPDGMKTGCSWEGLGARAVAGGVEALVPHSQTLPGGGAWVRGPPARVR